jgi:hypothetical protein
VVLRLVLPPSAVFVVIPVVIVLVLSIVDPDLNAGLLGRGGGHERHWRRKGSGQEERSDVSMYTVHVVILQSQNVRFRNRGRYNCAPKAG